MKTVYNHYSTCRHCGQDVQHVGRYQWMDRGGNFNCSDKSAGKGKTHQPNRADKK